MNVRISQPVPMGAESKAAARKAPFTLLGVNVQPLTLDELVSWLLLLPQDQHHVAVHFTNVHLLVESTKDPRLAAMLNQPDAIVSPDGMPLVWNGRLRRRSLARTTGPAVMAAMLDRGRDVQARHYLVGGAPGVAERIAANACQRFPGANIVGYCSPPFRPASRSETDAMIQQINALEPDFVWVGLGAPKQNLWTAEYGPSIDAAAVLAVGAAFDFIAGTRRQAPPWVGQIGCEWLYRFACEPRRLWRRYTLTNIRFAWLACRELAWRRRRAPSETVATK